MEYIFVIWGGKKLTDKNGKVISFINMKGGVGKTTLSIGIAD